MKQKTALKLQPSLPYRGASEKLGYTLLKTMTILTAQFDEGVKNRTVHFFVDNEYHAYKIL